jgi:hypothetical protein
MTTKKAARTGKDRLRGGGATGSRTKPATKKTDRRAGDKSTRVSRGQQQRSSALTEPKERVSGLERKRPARTQRVVEDQRKGQTPSRTSATRTRGR